MPDIEPVIVTDQLALAQQAAERVVARISKAQDCCAVCLTGGSTPERLFRLLGSEPWRSAIPWPRVHWFWGDERFVPADDPRSNAAMARRAFLDACPAPPENVHAIPTATPSPDAAARLHQATLKAFHGSDQLDPGRPLFDLVLMGMGPDGHTASLLPGAPALEETRRWVVGVLEPKFPPLTPRVTLTISALESTREMLFLVSGREKSDALRRVLSGEDLPAGRMRPDGELVWLVDRAAAGDET